MSQQSIDENNMAEFDNSNSVFVIDINDQYRVRATGAGTDKKEFGGSPLL